jgi:hypothetical protein
MSRTKDFYTNEHGLAAYFESSWLGHLLKANKNSTLQSLSGEIPYGYVNCSFYERLIQLVSSNMNSLELRPKSLLDIGPAPGRNCYEAINSFNSLRKVTVVEPSDIFLSNFRKIILNGGILSFP